MSAFARAERVEEGGLKNKVEEGRERERRGGGEGHFKYANGCDRI